MSLSVGVYAWICMQVGVLVCVDYVSRAEVDVRCLPQ